MHRFEVSEYTLNPHPQSSKLRIRLKYAEQKRYSDIESKHLHAIKPYVSKDRKYSKRDTRERQMSSIEISRSKSRRLDGSSRKDYPNGKSLNELLSYLSMLKHDYRSLKQAYSSLVKEKYYYTKRSHNGHNNTTQQIYQLTSYLARQKKVSNTFELEIERIKRECLKVLETERFKNKKLEYTLQEKELMIAYLRNEIYKTKGDIPQGNNCNQSSLFFLQSSAPIFTYEPTLKPSQNISMISNVANNIVIDSEQQNSRGRKDNYCEEDSLSFSRNKSKDFYSVHSLLTNNNDVTHLTFTKKDLIVLNDSYKTSYEETRKMSKVEYRKSTIDIEAKYKYAILVSKSLLRDRCTKVNTKRLQIITNENTDCNEYSSLDPVKKSSHVSNKSKKFKKKKDK